MLPAGSPYLPHYQQAFADMDSRYQVFSRFQENYAQSHQSACVHAEIQVLEHFYANEMRYAGDDPYVACSKPACFCCLLYFRHHPGHVVEPNTHNKIYLNWRPPEFSAPAGSIHFNHQRDILNAMNQDIRKEALRQIDERSASRAWHPDSVTGITQSAQNEQVRESLTDPDVISDIGGGSLMHGQVWRGPAAAEATDVSLSETTTMEECETTTWPRVSNVSTTNRGPELSEILQEEVVSDSDEGGGVQL